jgi:hypothetical protein
MVDYKFFSHLQVILFEGEKKTGFWPVLNLNLLLNVQEKMQLASVCLMQMSVNYIN